MRQRILVPLDSTNARFKRAYFGIRRLAKVEREIEERKKQIFTPYEWLKDYFYGSECK